jgi:predicted transcriptional regulator
MTPAKFIKIRKDAGLSLGQLSDIIRVHERTIRRYEDGTREISGPVSLIMELIRDGVLNILRR